MAVPPSPHAPLHLFSWEKYSDTLADVPPVGRHSDSRCEEPPTIDNGMHNGTKGTDFFHGSTVAYKCRDGFTLAGAAFLQCTAGYRYRGAWDKPAPECRGDSPVSVLLPPLCLQNTYFFSFLCESSNRVILLRNKPSMLPETASVKI